MSQALNETMYPGGTCFGCGQANDHGLHVRVYRDETRDDGLVGTLRAPSHATGFEGIVHGGALYTALDCLAGWTVLVLRGERTFAPFLRTATMRYRRPARVGVDLALRSRILREGARGEPVLVEVEARDPEGELLVRGELDLVPVGVAKLKEMLRVERLPPGWERLLDEG